MKNDLTAIALSVHEMSPNKIFDPERLADARSGRLLTLAVSRTWILAFQGVQLQNLEIEDVLAGLQLRFQLGNDVDAGDNDAGPVRQALVHQKV